MRRIGIILLTMMLVAPILTARAVGSGFEIELVHYANKSPFVLEGKAEAGSKIEVHGKGIGFTVGEEGKFSIDLDVVEGVNLFAITAEKNGLSSTKGFMVDLDTSPPEASLFLNGVLAVDKAVSLKHALPTLTIEGLAEPGCVIVANGKETVNSSMWFKVVLDIPSSPSKTVFPIAVKDRHGNVTGFEVTVTNPKETTVIMAIGKDKAIIDGVEVTMNAPLVIVEGKTYLPVKFFVEEFLKGSYSYDEATKTATLEKDGKVVRLQVGNINIIVDDKVSGRTSAPILRSNQFMASVRAACDPFGCTVNYYAGTKELIISFFIEQ